MYYSRFDPFQFCETCGAKIYYDYWGHAIACARHKQQQEAARRAVENGKEFVDRLRRGTEEVRG